MKKFIVEIDHKNLLYTEPSEAYIVIRWRICLQTFSMLLRHIPGKTNVVADWGSRTFFLPLAEVEEGLEPGRLMPLGGDSGRNLWGDFDLEDAT